MLGRAFFFLFMLGVVLVPSFGFAARNGNLLPGEEWIPRGGGEVYQDVLAVDYAGKYVAIAAFVQAEEGAEVRMFVEVLNAQGRVVEVRDDASFAYNAFKRGWGVIHAVMPLPPSSAILRLYVTQRDDWRALVSRVTVRGVGSRAEGRAFVHDVYLSSLFFEEVVEKRKVDLSCTASRETKEVEVRVTPEVYAKGKEHDGRWILWAANETAGMWKDWGKGKMFGESWGNRASGFLCAKSGDEIRLNGMFSERDDWYLVYTVSGTQNPADQMVEARVGGEKYEIGEGENCRWDANGLGGFDVVCTVR